MRRRIVLVETSDIGARYSAEAVRSLGFEPFFVCDLRHYQADPREQILANPHLDCETSDSAVLADRLRQAGIGDIEGVMTFADPRLSVAVELADQVQAHGLDATVPALKSKARVARLLPEFSPQTVSFAAGDFPFEEISVVLKAFGKVIVKPDSAAGGAGTFVLESVSDLDRLPELLAQQQIPAGTDATRWIAQGHVPGTLVSVEGFAIDGRPTLLGFSGRKRVRATETGAEFPLDERIDDSVQAKAWRAVETLLWRSKFKNGYFHIEFIVTHAHEPNCYLIDANVGRIGGGPIAQQLALSFGRDPVEIYRHVIQVGLFEGHGADPELYSAPRRRTSAILYGLEQGGKIERLHLPERLGCYHTQVLAPGAVASPVGRDDWAWIGILSGLEDETQAAVRQIRIETPEGIQTPYY